MPGKLQLQTLRVYKGVLHNGVARRHVKLGACSGSWNFQLTGSLTLKSPSSSRCPPLEVTSSPSALAILLLLPSSFLVRFASNRSGCCFTLALSLPRGFSLSAMDADTRAVTRSKRRTRAGWRACVPALNKSDRGIFLSNDTRVSDGWSGSFRQIAPARTLPGARPDATGTSRGRGSGTAPQGIQPTRYAVWYIFILHSVLHCMH